MPLTPRITGEDDLVREFLATLAAGFPGALGLKDDCAVLAVALSRSPSSRARCRRRG